MKMKVNEKKGQKVKEGFTLIELSLSMAIIGVLSITVMLIISNAVSAYHKGLTLNQLNTVGMSIVEDIRVAIQASPARSVVDECVTLYDGSGSGSVEGAQASCANDKAASFVTQVGMGRVVTVDGDDYSDIPLEGLFCTGKYTYIWNSGYLVNGGTGLAMLRLKYKTSDGVTTTEDGIRLLKVHDENRMICKATAGYKSTGSGEASKYIDSQSDPLATYGSNIIDISELTVLDDEPEDLLENNGGLAVYNLDVTQPATVENLDVMFYAVSMILGTLRGGPDIRESSDVCKAPDELGSDFDYCAINKFNFAARAVGGSNAL